MDDRDQPRSNSDEEQAFQLPASASLSGLNDLVLRFVNDVCAWHQRSSVVPIAAALSTEQLTAIAALTDRQLLYIRLACDPREFSPKQIAAQMSMSRSGVEKCGLAVCRKLGVRGRSGLVLLAIKAGLVKV